MKTKKFLAFLLTILMIGGMLPTVFAADIAEGSAGVTLVYDFTSTALIKPDGTPNINADKVSNTPTVGYAVINGYTLDRTRSTGDWKFEHLINVDAAPFQYNGLYFKTSRSGITANNNAVVFTINVPSSGTYTASVSDYKNYFNNEWTDIYIVSKDVVAANGWDVKTIGGVQSAIAVSSMTDSTASVKHIASYDACYNATGENDKLAENVFLFAGDYYMFVVASDSSTDPTPGTEDAGYVWGMLSKLTLTSEAAVAPERVTYSFLSTAGKSDTTIDMNSIKNYNYLDREISTGAWCFFGINGMSLNKMYPEVNGGGTFRVDNSQANIGNHAIILQAKLENSGLYKPSMVYRTASTYGKLDIYFVPVSYASSKWTSITTSWNLAEVLLDSGVKLVASQNGYSSKSAIDVLGEYENVYLNADDYYVIIDLGWEGEGTVPEKTFFITKDLTLTRQPEVVVSASSDTVSVGKNATVSSILKDEGGNAVPTSSVTYKSLTPSVATINENGVVTGVEEGVATIQVTASSCGVEFTDTIDITVSRDAKYVFTSGATDGTLLDFIRYANIDSAVSAPWRFMCKTNIDTGNVNEYGLNFRVLKDNIGNGGYVLKISVENPGIYTPAVTWTARDTCSIVDTYIVPAAYANERWPMTNNINLKEIVSDPGVTLIASADMSTGEKKIGNPVKLSDDEYYVIVVISDIGNGNDSQGRAFGYLKSLEFDWVSALSEDVENQYVSLAIANNVNDNIEIKGNQYTRGDEIEVEAPEIDGYTFRHWVRGTEENGELVSTDAKFTYKLITNAYLTAVYTQDTTANTVEFFGGNGEYITSAEVVDGAVVTPAAPKLTGFKFINWYTAKDKLLSETALDAAVTRAVAVFGDADESFSVEGEENLKYDTKITKTYSEPVVWYRDDVRVGYGTTYEYYVWDNVGKITYVEGTAQPLIVLDKAVKDGNARMIEYDAGGKKIVEVGILFGNGENMTVDSCMYKATSKKNSAHGQFTAKPANTTQTAARGYMIYQDGNEYKVVYSD